MLLLLIVVPVLAQQNDVHEEKNIPVAFFKGPTDPGEMESFLDGLLKKEMEENYIVGAAVSVVIDGTRLFAKGYGYADLENKILVDSEQTLFKIGSVTKLLTWTAVMQLVE